MGRNHRTGVQVKKVEETPVLDSKCSPVQSISDPDFPPDLQASGRYVRTFHSTFTVSQNPLHSFRQKTFSLLAEVVSTARDCILSVGRIRG